MIVSEFLCHFYCFWTFLHIINSLGSQGLTRHGSNVETTLPPPLGFCIRGTLGFLDGLGANLGLRREEEEA